MESKRTDTPSTEFLLKGTIDLSPRVIIMEKKLLEALLYSHFVLAPRFGLTEIEGIKIEGNKLTITYSKKT